MKAIVYTRSGDPGVLELVERPMPAPGPGEVLVKVAVSGVNPTDWKNRGNADPAGGWQIPNQDGAGVVEAVGEGVDASLVGARVWVYLSAYQRPWGTAAQYTLVPVHRVVRLGEAGFELGAALGVPFVTAHRCLTGGESTPQRLGPGTLQDRVVLVQGGAGAVGNAAVQLAHWSGATVLTTVSSPQKAQLAAAAGADHVIDYRTQDVVAEVRRIAPGGVDLVAEVAPAANAAVDAQILAPHGSVLMYANDGGDELRLPVRPQMMLNSRWQFVLLYTLSPVALGHAVDDVAAAVAQSAVRVGPEAGLPLHHFPLEATADAHAAVHGGAIGKVLITVG
jgi:NADPH2:quinone reductase